MRKTHELLIDFSRNQGHVVPYINMDGAVIQCSDKARILGVTFSSDLNWNVHVDNIISKAGKRIYMLYQLRAGIDQGDLLRTYVSVIRPVVEYACPVWSTNLPKYWSDSIETVQKRALKSIYPGYTYEEILKTHKKKGAYFCEKWVGRTPSGKGGTRSHACYIHRYPIITGLHHSRQMKTSCNGRVRSKFRVENKQTVPDYEARNLIIVRLTSGKNWHVTS